MESYERMLDEDATLILSTNSELFKFLKDIKPGE